MTVNDIKLLLGAEVINGEDRLNTNVYSAFSSDLMSDVLAFVQERTVLITGLMNVHVFRTAQMIDVSCIIFSRGKKPTEDLLDMAKELNLIILSTTKTSYQISGILYSNGLSGIEV